MLKPRKRKTDLVVGVGVEAGDSSTEYIGISPRKILLNPGAGGEAGVGAGAEVEVGVEEKAE